MHKRRIGYNSILIRIEDESIRRRLSSTELTLYRANFEHQNEYCVNLTNHQNIKAPAVKYKALELNKTYSIIVGFQILKNIYLFNF